MSEASRAFRRLADCCNQLATELMTAELEREELNRTFPVITPVELRALVQHVIDQQQQGFDALASAAWDRVVEYMEATDAKANG